MNAHFERTHQHDGNGSAILANPRFGDVTSGRFFEVLSSGQAVQRGQSVMYDDMNFPFSTGRTSQNNAPTWTTMLAPFSAYTFAVNDFLQVAAQEFPHQWDEGTPAELHVHMITNGTNVNARYVKHRVQATWANAYTENDMSAYTTVQTFDMEIEIPANTPDRTHLVHSVGILDMTGGRIGAYLGLHYTRIAAAGTAPTSNPFVVAVGVHIKKNTIGSLSMYEKGL